MSAPTYKQDLPPPGGYKPIQFLRVPAKTYFTGIQMFIVFNIIHFGSLYYWFQTTNVHRRRMTVEERSTRFVLQPLLIAEKDRAYLKRCRKLREEEEELMKDVPGWVVGTYWGEPIYHTRPADEWQDITPREYFAHSPDYQYKFFMNFYKYL